MTAERLMEDAYDLWRACYRLAEARNGWALTQHREAVTDAHQRLTATLAALRAKDVAA